MESVPFFTDGPIAFDGLEERARQSETGAVVSFQGVVRPDRTDLGNVVALEFEKADADAESEVSQISLEVAEKWPGTQVLWQTRVGRVPVGETSMLLLVSSPQRAAAFLACHYALEQMKCRVPLRKKDIFSDGSSRWSDQHRETMLISDSVLTYPPS
ncbi:MAG: molybdenum cofactor biosynthesis protein MoaE [Elusimicrobia bacterium]|nr:molybdenum cofactor biosynthesis protein MoaE [Elusimicrobiota bacterium]